MKYSNRAFFILSSILFSASISAQSFDLKESRRALNENPAAYVIGGVSCYATSIMGGQAAQYVLVSAALAVPAAATFCIPAAALLHAVTLCDSVERLTALYTGHQPILAQYNPTAHLASWMARRLDTSSLFKDPNDPIWNHSLERGKYDFSIIATATNGLISFWKLLGIGRDLAVYFQGAQNIPENFEVATQKTASKSREIAVQMHAQGGKGTPDEFAFEKGYLEIANYLKFEVSIYTPKQEKAIASRFNLNLQQAKNLGLFRFDQYDLDTLAESIYQESGDAMFNLARVAVPIHEVHLRSKNMSGSAMGVLAIALSKIPLHEHRQFIDQLSSVRDFFQSYDRFGLDKAYFAEYLSGFNNADRVRVLTLISRISSASNTFDRLEFQKNFLEHLTQIKSPTEQQDFTEQFLEIYNLISTDDDWGLWVFEHISDSLFKLGASQRQDLIAHVKTLPIDNFHDLLRAVDSVVKKVPYQATKKCGICLDPCILESSEIVLTCGHSFHHECLVFHWLKTDQETCPNCVAHTVIGKR